MTIQQLLAMPIGERIGGFSFTVKKTKGYIQLPDNSYVFTVVLVDETGEMLADFVSKDYLPLIKGREIHIIVSEIQAVDSTGRAKIDQVGKKLFVEQYFTVVSGLAEPDEWKPDLSGEGEIVRSKVRCLLVCADKSAGKIPDKADILDWTEFIITGR